MSFGKCRSLLAKAIQRPQEPDPQLERKNKRKSDYVKCSCCPRLNSWRFNLLLLLLCTGFFFNLTLFRVWARSALPLRALQVYYPGDNEKIATQVVNKSLSKHMKWVPKNTINMVHTRSPGKAKQMLHPLIDTCPFLEPAFCCLDLERFRRLLKIDETVRITLPYFSFVI